MRQRTVVGDGGPGMGCAGALRKKEREFHVIRRNA